MSRDTNTDTARSNDVGSRFAWSARMRGFVSLAIVLHLAAVIISPLTLPLRQGQEIAADAIIPAIPSQALLGPARGIAGKYGQLTYLNHGYQFFAPDPGPSHIVEYEITKDDGSTIKGRFPDRDRYWPRLRYHRWFMLSETLSEELEISGTRVYLLRKNELIELLQSATRAGRQSEIEQIRREFDLIKPEKLHLAQQEQLNKAISELNKKGARSEALRLSKTYGDLDLAYQQTQTRFKLITTSVANFLLREHDGASIKLFVLQRDIPYRSDVLKGIKLDDDRFLEDSRFELISLSRSELQE